jgi:hypothetical protein
MTTQNKKDSDAQETGRMCMNLTAVKDAQAVGYDVESTVCGSGKTGEPSCPYRHECAYQKQKAAVAAADVVIVAHQALFHEMPSCVTKGLGLIVIDEKWWQAGVITAEEMRIAGFAEEPLIYPVLTRGKRQVADDEATNDLHELSRRAMEAFAATPDGALVSKAAILASGLTADDCAMAVKLEWKRKLENAIWPGMSADERKKAMARAKGNASIAGRVRIWRALGEALTRGETHTGRLEMSAKGAADGAGRTVLVHSRREICEDIAALPILSLDATMPTSLIQNFLPDFKVLADMQPHAPHMTVIQITGGWGKTTLIPGPAGKVRDEENDRRRARLAELRDFVRLNSPDSGLVVTYQDLEDEFAGICGGSGFLDSGIS